MHMTVLSKKLLFRNQATITERSTRHGEGEARRPLMPGNRVGPLRHRLIHIPPLHLNILNPEHNPTPTHTITTDQSQVRSFIQVRNLPEGAASEIR